MLQVSGSIPDASSCGDLQNRVTRDGNTELTEGGQLRAFVEWAPKAVRAKTCVPFIATGRIGAGARCDEMSGRSRSSPALVAAPGAGARAVFRCVARTPR